MITNNYFHGNLRFDRQDIISVIRLYCDQTGAIMIKHELDEWTSINLNLSN